MNGNGARLTPEVMRANLSEVWEWHTAESRTNEAMLEDMHEAAMQLMIHLGFEPMNKGVLDDLGYDPESSIVQTLLEVLYRRLPTQFTYLLNLLSTLPDRREAFETAVIAAISFDFTKDSMERMAKLDARVLVMFTLLPTEEDKAWARDLLDKGLREAVMNFDVNKAHGFNRLYTNVRGY